MELAKKHTEDAVHGLIAHPPAVFKMFSDEELRGILASGEMIVVEPDTEIQPKVSDHSVEGYLIVDGVVQVWRSGQLIEKYGSGEFIGEAFLHTRAFANCELRTKTTTVFLVFKRDHVLEFFRNRPEKLLKLFTINVVDAQQRHINGLYKRIAEILNQNQETL